MKKLLLLSLVLLSFMAIGQVGLGTTTPSSSSVLDMGQAPNR